MSESVWKLAPKTDGVLSLAEELDVPVIIAQLLVNRGIDEKEEALRFMYGTLDDVYDPFQLQGMPAAVDRLRKAASQGENVLVFGDYDVDGVLSVVILSRALSILGAKVDYYIPDRLEEGYGLKPAYVKILEQKQANVVVSVDCGIKALDFVKEATRIGVDVIITDHHQPGDQLPEALAVLNPVLKGSKYPNPYLAGIGVVFKLIQALYQGHPKESQVPHYLKLVSIGTVADVVPLTRENRIFVKYGLEALKNISNLGLQSLLSTCGLDGKSIRVSDVGFRIAPRINAAGRMGKADLAVQLFFSDSPEECGKLATELDEMNASRQTIEKNIYLQAKEVIQSRSLDQRYKLLILGCDGWHRGVIGIVASKLKEDFNRPVLLFSYENGKAHGSGRSIREFSLIDCLNQNPTFFTNFGGHPMAVGCELPVSALSEFKQAINTFADTHISSEDLLRKIRIDGYLDFDEMGTAFLELFSRLGPYGVGNPRPVFLTENVQVVSAPRRLQDRHIKLFLKQNGRYFDAVGWNKSAWVRDIKKGSRLDAVYSLQIKEYLGEERLSLILEDMRPIS